MHMRCRSITVSRIVLNADLLPSLARLCGKGCSCCGVHEQPPTAVKRDAGLRVHGTCILHLFREYPIYSTAVDTRKMWWVSPAHIDSASTAVAAPRVGV